MPTAETLVSQAARPRQRRAARLLPDRRQEGRSIAARLEAGLQDLGEDAALAALPGALAGDAAPAAELIAQAPRSLRGVCALVLHLHDVPASVMRDVLGTIAFIDHAALLAAVPQIGRVIAMCRHAGTDAPDSLPDTFPVWRGVRDMGIKRGSRGLVWTLNRAAACWAATCDNTNGAYPLLLTATARRVDVGLQDGDNLILARVTDARTDGEQGPARDWRAIGAEYRQGQLAAEMTRRGIPPGAAATGAHP